MVRKYHLEINPTATQQKFQYIYSSWLEKVIPRRHGLLNENLTVRHGLPLYKLLVRGSPDALRTTQAVVTAIGYLL